MFLTFLPILFNLVNLTSYNYSKCVYIILDTIYMYVYIYIRTSLKRMFIFVFIYVENYSFISYHFFFFFLFRFCKKNKNKQNVFCHSEYGPLNYLYNCPVMFYDKQFIIPQYIFSLKIN